jgi:hypothetical protein
MASVNAFTDGGLNALIGGNGGLSFDRHRSPQLEVDGTCAQHSNWHFETTTEVRQIDGHSGVESRFLKWDNLTAQLRYIAYSKVWSKWKRKDALASYFFLVSNCAKTSSAA